MTLAQHATLLLKVAEAAAELRVSVDKVYDLIAAGILPCIDVAAEGSTRASLRIQRADLEAYVAHLAQNATTTSTGPGRPRTPKKTRP